MRKLFRNYFALQLQSLAQGGLWLDRQRCDFYDYRLTFAFATLREPCAQAFRKPFRSQTKASFNLAIGNGQSVIEFGGIGEIAHAELVEPLERARLGLTANHNIHVKFLCVHAG